MMLDVSGATKSFGGRLIFSDFDLSLERGSFKVLVGPSGCGKSTLFDSLTGVTGLDRGQILWQGTPVDTLKDHAAYMQQKDLLLPWFTLMENSLLPVKTGPRPNQKKGGEQFLAQDKAGRLFNRLGLSGFEDHYPGQVSGGMRQRCALVRTLMFDRELILLDEPLSALDAITRQGLQDLLLILQSEFGKTILMITHDIEEALVLGDEICLLSRRPMAVTRSFCPDTPKPRPFNHPEIVTARARVLERLKKEAIHDPV